MAYGAVLDCVGKVWNPRIGAEKGELSKDIWTRESMPIITSKRHLSLHFCPHISPEALREMGASNPSLPLGESLAYT